VDYKPPHLDDTSVAYDLVVGMALHNAYHLGQIVLRRMQGLRPQREAIRTILTVSCA